MGEHHHSKIDINNLCNAFLSMQSADECRAFLNDLCTPLELRSMAQRLEVASKLKQGEVYSKIASETGVSTTTIVRVNRAMTDGEGGYEIVLERLEEKD